ncbi:hypothetical protein RvY_19372 [Ramazzottius varieornatus]|uniref:Uncharacterized protein n=1 Tax=Ramazzottius varieornatus TaxID=947166 RepID=A0A1D1W6W9_RAMVA|nr:hypothetical protein RvY_18725 [Ramazzottius varieornatus]GAV09904.1 hypothetical protein RvY_19372 [Ramazzottius varieornatus]
MDLSDADEQKKKKKAADAEETKRKEDEDKNDEDEEGDEDDEDNEESDCVTNVSGRPSGKELKVLRCSWLVGPAESAHIVTGFSRTLAIYTAKTCESSSEDGSRLRSISTANFLSGVPL